MTKTFPSRKWDDHLLLIFIHTYLPVDSQSEFDIAIRAKFWAHFETPRLLHGRPVDAIVSKNHDEEWSIEWDDWGEDEVANVLGEGALEWGDGLVSGRPPPQNGWEWDEARAEPHERDKETSPIRRHARGVAERVRDGPVSVEWNHAQVEYWRRRGQNVQRVPKVAPILAKNPALVHQFENGLKRHHDEAHETVGDGEGRDEVVGHGVKIPLASHGDHDERIAKDRGRTKGGEKHGQGDVVGRDALHPFVIVPFFRQRGVPGPWEVPVKCVVILHFGGKGCRGKVSKKVKLFLGWLWSHPATGIIKHCFVLACITSLFYDRFNPCPKNPFVHKWPAHFPVFAHSYSTQTSGKRVAYAGVVEICCYVSYLQFNFSPFFLLNVTHNHRKKHPHTHGASSKLVVELASFFDCKKQSKKLSTKKPRIFLLSVYLNPVIKETNNYSYGSIILWDDYSHRLLTSTGMEEDS